MTSIGIRGDDGPPDYRDFGSFWAAGDAANRGLDPYGDHALTRGVDTPVGERAAINLNPPAAVLLFQLLALIDPAVAFRVWQVASGAMYLVVVAVLLRALRPPDWWELGLLMLAWAPFWSTIDLAQIYVPLLALAATAYLRLDRSPWLAGACIGLIIAVKPQFAIWPVLLLAGAYWRPVAAAVGTWGMASLLPALLGHADWYARWISTSRMADMLVYSDNLSVMSFLYRAGVSEPAAALIVGGGLLALFVVVAWRRWSARRVSDLAVVAAVLAGPISWVGYVLLLAPMFLSRTIRSERLMLAAILLAVPGVLLWWSQAGSGIYVLALGLCLWVTLVDSYHGATSSRARSPRLDFHHNG
jgi:hypothetical protein